MDSCIVKNTHFLLTYAPAECSVIKEIPYVMFYGNTLVSG